MEMIRTSPSGCGARGEAQTEAYGGSWRRLLVLPGGHVRACIGPVPRPISKHARSGFRACVVPWQVIMDRLSVSGGSPVCAEYWSQYGHSAVTLGDPPERTTG